MILSVICSLRAALMLQSKKMTEAVKEGKDLLPDVSPALKVATGRAR